MAQEDTRQGAKNTSSQSNPSVQELQEKLQRAEAKLQQFGISEDLQADINARARVLTHEQAVRCARRQQAHDAVLAQDWTKRETEKQEALIAAGSLP